LDDVKLMESPGRKKRRDEAFKAQQKQASQMKKRAKLKDGKVNVGCVVQIGISNYDKTKLDAPNLTCVVVEFTKSGKFRLACKVGVIKTLYGMNRISVMKTGTKELLGIEDAFKEWKGMSTILEREAASRTSNIGGQGFIKCSCKGKCNTKSCSCKKHGRICISHCHKENNYCTNHD